VGWRHDAGGQQGAVRVNRREIGLVLNAARMLFHPQRHTEHQAVGHFILGKVVLCCTEELINGVMYDQLQHLHLPIARKL
jgi:hypothetical protein